MPFNPHDIETQLHYSSAGPGGVYDQLHWSVRTGSDATELESRVVSVHEFMHNELNNLTAYGFLLQGYAYLSREDTPLKNQYTGILHELVERCRTAHEVYATWQGIALFSHHAADELHRELLKDNEEYEAYYNCAAELVKYIPDLYLRRQVVSAVIYACFQSSTVAETAEADLAAFNPAAISAADFPSARLAFITGKFPADCWPQLIKEFAGEQTQASWYNILVAGHADENAFLDIANDEAGERLVAFIYERLSAAFCKEGLHTLPYKSHMAYFRKLLPAMDALSPFKNSKNPVMINTQPDDITRGVLQNFENETLQFHDQPLTCFLFHPDDISPEIKKDILSGAGELPHIFITGRNLPFMRDQYIFPDEEDKAWCDSGNDTFTAIRYSGITEEGVRLVFYVPFSKPEQLMEFLKDKPENVFILGAVSVTASYDDDWWERWADFFSTQCTTTCLVLDISPLYYIENIFPDDGVLYGKMHIRMQEQLKSCMYFQLTEHGETTAFLVAPCSEMYAQALGYYIQNRFAGYKNEISLPEHHSRNIPMILSHIFREEHKCYYRSQKS